MEQRLCQGTREGVMSIPEIEVVRSLKRPMKPKQRTQFSVEEVESCSNKLSARDLEIIETAMAAPTYVEISAALNLNRGTVKSRLSRARARLSKHLSRIKK